MIDGLEFTYNPEIESFVMAVCNAYATYIRIFKAFPKQIDVPPDDAGYQTPLLYVHIDSALPKSTFWLGR